MTTRSAVASEISVIDAGGRYGVHPTWRRLRGRLRYTMFEPDRAEAARLAKKYAANPEIEVVANALGEKTGELRINVLRHHGQSTAFQPNLRSTWFGRTRKGEGDVVDHYDAPMTTVDTFCDERQIAVDFMKVDTEGSELSVLRGAAGQLAMNVLGVRCEVYFDEVYIGAPRFPEIYNFLTNAGFKLLNLDYSGGGASFGPFHDGNRYGSLSGCDALWVRAPGTVLEGGSAIQILKYATFCMRNGATDLALHMLETAADDPRTALDACIGTEIMNGIDVEVQQLFYRLAQKPRFDFEFLQETYGRIFRHKLKSMHEFFESDDINPE